MSGPTVHQGGNTLVNVTPPATPIPPPLLTCPGYQPEDEKGLGFPSIFGLAVVQTGPAVANYGVEVDEYINQ